MDILKFITQFSGKPKKHGDIWFYILCNINNGVNTLQLQSIFNISNSSLYRIFNIYNTDINNNNETLNIYIDKTYIKCNINKKVTKQIKRKEKEPLQQDNIYKQIIEHLNIQSGKKFSYKSNATIKFIDSRLKEKYILDDFKKEIDIKCTKWLNTSMEDYIRPQTLFSNKFEGYINESLVSVNNNKKDTVDKANETINKAKQFDWEFDSKS